MGVIQSQGIKNSLVNYFATGIGFIATLFIYPFDLEAKGLINYLIDLGALFVPYAQLGLFAVYYKYFPRFSDQLGAFQKWVVKRILIQFGFFLILFYLLREPLAEFLAYAEIDKSGSFNAYSPFLPLVLFCILFQGFLVMISVTNQRIVIPDLIKNIIQKIYFPTIVILKFTFDLETNTFIGLFFLYYCITIPLLLWYVLKNKFLQIKNSTQLLISKSEKKEIRMYNGFSLLNDISTQLSFKLDSVMVGSLINLTQTGIYGIMFYMSNVLSTSTVSILNITNPIVSKKMAENDIEGVSALYKKASITLFIFGLGVFFSLWFLLDDILSLTKYSEQLKVGKYVFLYLGIAKLFDMITSINTYILVYSKYYRFNLIFVATLGVCNIFLNLSLIPKYGIEGAAMASLIALILFNTLKLSLIYLKLKIHPFSKETAKVLVIGAISFIILYFIPEGKYIQNSFVNLLIKGTIICSTVILTFALPIYLLKISKEINGLVDKVLIKMKILK
ncbi:MAG: O-antigen/teichoic acid export membrane protein [Flavobacteriales bacterium]|jgi:O-antigen/teichoic acid export membrane protein|tara:strand:- start:56 stop:1567 length:1512 start_codon:yes stop_codon:yes gene_type:complete